MHTNSICIVYWYVIEATTTPELLSAFLVMQVNDTKLI